MRGTTLVRPQTAFYFAFALIVTTCWMMTRSQAFAAHSDVAAWGVTFDLTITLPALYWLLVIRTGNARPLTLGPVFVAGSLVARLVLPGGQQHFLHQLGEVIGPLAEVALLIAVVRRIVEMRRSPDAATDPHARLRRAAQAVAGEGRIAEAIASELTMFYYALFCWRKRPADEARRTFTVHERNGWGTIAVCIAVMIVAESIGMHLLLRLWSPRLAWCWSALDLWALAWIAGDYHALRLRLPYIDGEALHLRYGMRWSVSVPLSQISSIEPVRSEEEWKRRDTLKVAILDSPTWLITLKQPLVASGLAGIRKSIRAIALLPDDENAISALRLACAEAAGSSALR